MSLNTICNARLMALKCDLHDKQVRLRDFVGQDAPSVAQHLQNKNVSSMTTNIPHPYTEEHALSWVAGQSAQRDACSALHWAIERAADRQLVGAISLEINARDEVGDLGYWIGESFWGEGLATAATSLVTIWSLKSGFAKIAARCLAGNVGSRRVLEKCGFLLEGRLRSHVIRMGSRQDMLCYGLLPGP